MRKSLSFTARALFGAVVATALAGSLAAGPASADIADIDVLGLTDGTSCDIGTGCSIHARTSNSNKLDPVEFFVDGKSIGTVTPVAYGSSADASITWYPTEYGTYTVGARQGLSAVSVVHIVHQPGTCAWLPSGSASGSANTGSASGSAGTGSAGTGSADSGSAGTGSAGSGSAGLC